jgi:hypothetical protein
MVIGTTDDIFQVDQTVGRTLIPEIHRVDCFLQLRAAGLIYAACVDLE